MRAISSKISSNAVDLRASLIYEQTVFRHFFRSFEDPFFPEISIVVNLSSDCSDWSYSSLFAIS